MAETELHRDGMIYAIDVLSLRYAGRPDTQVSGNNFVYYVEGDRRKVVSPDVYVVFGVPKRPRDTYMVWKEGGKYPDLVFEYTSLSTRRADERSKRALYEAWGVSEYFLFDPKGEYLQPRLQGFRLQDARFVPIPMEAGRLYSARLELELVTVGEHLRFYDPAAGEWLRTYAEAETERLAAKQRVEIERQRADAASQRADAASERADAEGRRADVFEERADAERRRADALEAEVKQLRAEQEIFRHQNDT
jgi:Uma2 family endonuclease